MVRGAGTTDQAVVEVGGKRTGGVFFCFCRGENQRTVFAAFFVGGRGTHSKIAHILRSFLRSCLALSAIYVRVLFAFKTRQLFIAAILRSQKGISFDASYKEQKDT